MPLSPPVALSLFYVAFFAAFGAYLPYLNLYLEGIGLTGPQIGVISALLPLSVIVFPAIGGILADRLGRRRGLIIGSSGLSFLTFASILEANEQTDRGVILVGEVREIDRLLRLWRDRAGERGEEVGTRCA